MSKNRPYTALIRPKGGMKETLPPGSKISRRGVEYIFVGIIQEGINRGKIGVARESNGLIVHEGYKYPSEFGCEVVY
jgi:hypothetical protein